MKNILLLYKKLWAENKIVIMLYLLLLLITTALLFRYAFYVGVANLEGMGGKDISWVYNKLQESIWAMIFVVVSFSFVISIHWGIRHFNYSPQSYHYNTLPLSLLQKFGFILSYVFLLLPIVHILALSLMFLPMSTISAPTSFHRTPGELYTDTLKHLAGDAEKWFPFSHVHFFMGVFLLTALFFNKMGFIKTVVASSVIMIAGLLLYVNLNFKVWDTRGDFGTELSILRSPSLYTLHYTCISVFFVAILYTVYKRLADKNY